MLNRRILRLAIPNIVTNITIPLLATIDLGLMGFSGSVQNVGAVALGGMIFSFLFRIFSFLRMGTSGFTAQAFGRKDLGETAHILIRALLTAFFAGIVLIAMQKPIAWAVFQILHASVEVEALALQYFSIRIWAAPATLFLYVAIGWFIGMQNARFPMILSISINVLNVLLSIYFIKVLHLGSSGVAWANVISQYVGLAGGLAFMWVYYPRLKKYINGKQLFDKGKFLSFFYVNIDIFIRTLCLIFTLSFFTAKSASKGDNILAINTLLFQFFYFFSYFIDGFAYAAEALTGKYLGAGNRQGLFKLIRRLLSWGVGIALIFTLVYMYFGESIFLLLTNDTNVIHQSKSFMVWVAIIPITTFAAFIWDGIYVGATESKIMRNSMLIITILIFLPSYYIFEPTLGNHGLWFSITLFMVARGLFLWIEARKIELYRLK